MNNNQFDAFSTEKLKEVLWDSQSFLILRVDDEGLHLHLKIGRAHV